MIKKLPHNITDEELLSALNSAEDNTNEIDWHNDVPLFLSKFKIDQGKFKVKIELLYKLYRIYSKEPCTRISFTSTVSNFVEKTDRHFIINKKPSSIMKLVYGYQKESSLNFHTNVGIKKHYELFLQKCGIKKSTSWIESAVLYEIYRFYCIDTKKKTRMSYPNFIKLSKLYFKSKRIGSSKAVWFQIDSSVVSKYLSKDDIERLNSRKRTIDEEGKRVRSEANKGKKVVFTEQHRENLRLAALNYYAKRREQNETKEKDE